MPYYYYNKNVQKIIITVHLILFNIMGEIFIIFSIIFWGRLLRVYMCRCALVKRQYTCTNFYRFYLYTPVHLLAFRLLLHTCTDVEVAIRAPRPHILK